MSRWGFGGSCSKQNNTMPSVGLTVHNRIALLYMSKPSVSTGHVQY